MKATNTDTVNGPRPTARQVDVTTAIVAWYVRHYHRTPEDAGLPAMFFDRSRVGHFAIDRAAFEVGDNAALFRLLIATTMFQRRQDVQILRILRGINKKDAAALTSARSLLRHVDRSACPLIRTNTLLLGDCDLAKDAETRLGCCSRGARIDCDLKRHTVLLKRYGHFGKVPTSAALTLREAGAHGLRDLYEQVVSTDASPLVRARLLEKALSRSWRISEKIACMFLSAASNPDLSERPPWSTGLEWEHFVVVDSNVDAFLKSVRYTGVWTYEARREFIKRLAGQIDLTSLVGGVRAYNPRVVQQAIYLFMSAANRRAIPRDCSFVGPTACNVCPRALASRCTASGRLAQLSSTANES